MGYTEPLAAHAECPLSAEVWPCRTPATADTAGTMIVMDLAHERQEAGDIPGGKIASVKQVH